MSHKRAELEAVVAELKNLQQEIEVDAEKFLKGNKIAGTRVRNYLQRTRELGFTGRKLVQAIRQENQR